MTISALFKKAKDLVNQRPTALLTALCVTGAAVLVGACGSDQETKMVAAKNAARAKEASLVEDYDAMLQICLLNKNVTGYHVSFAKDETPIFSKYLRGNDAPAVYIIYDIDHKTMTKLSIDGGYRSTSAASIGTTPEEAMTPKERATLAALTACATAVPAPQL